MASVFEKFSGKNVILVQTGDRFYVPDEEESEELIEEAVENLHPNGELEEGWAVVAIGAYFEEGEMVQCDSFLAIHVQEDRAYISDEGSLRFLEEPASKLTLELDEDA